VTFTGNAGRFKQSFTMEFQMLLCSDARHTVIHCDTDQYLVVEKIREQLAVNKKNHTDFISRGSISRS
jgi:hypothetical protein